MVVNDVPRAPAICMTRSTVFGAPAHRLALGVESSLVAKDMHRRATIVYVHQYSFRTV